MKKSKMKTTNLIPVQRKTQTEESDRENQTTNNSHVVEDDLNPPMAWTSIKLNFGLTLPFIVIEHLFFTDEGLAWEGNNGKPNVAELNYFGSAIRRTGLAYLRLRERVHARALQELPLADPTLVPTLGMAGIMIDEAFHDSIAEAEEALYRRPVWLDYFADCVFPLVRQKLQAKLGIPVEPATVFQRWLLDSHA